MNFGIIVVTGGRRYNYWTLPVKFSILCTVLPSVVKNLGWLPCFICLNDLKKKQLKFFKVTPPPLHL